MKHLIKICFLIFFKDTFGKTQSCLGICTYGIDAVCFQNPAMFVFTQCYNAGSVFVTFGLWQSDLAKLINGELIISCKPGYLCSSFPGCKSRVIQKIKEKGSCKDGKKAKMDFASVQPIKSQGQDSDGSFTGNPCSNAG